MSEWPSGLRRQTQGSKPCFPVGSEYEISGPLMRAGVRIPFLTNLFFIQPYLPCAGQSALSLVLLPPYIWGYSSVVEHPAAVR